MALSQSGKYEFLVFHTCPRVKHEQRPLRLHALFNVVCLMVVVGAATAKAESTSEAGGWKVGWSNAV